jgi:multidrug efflux pump
MRDVVGRLFREFAISLSIAILLSAVISLTLTPMMCAHILRHREKGEGNFLSRRLDAFFEKVIRGYDHGLHWVFRHQLMVLLITIGTLLLSVFLYIYVPKGFLPLQDTGIIQGFSIAPQDISFESMANRQRALAEAVMKDQDVESVSSFIGIDGVNTTLNNGRMMINLVPLEKGRDKAPVIMERLQKRAAAVSGISLHLQSAQDLTIEERINRAQYQFVAHAVRQNDIDVWVPRILAALNKDPIIRDISTDLQNKGLQAWLDVDKDTAYRLGVSMSDIDNALYNAFGQRQISTIFTQANQYHVVLEVEGQFSRGIRAIEDIYVPNAEGTLVPLRSFAKVVEKTTPLSVNRQGQFPAVAISFNLAEGASLDSAIEAINADMKAIGLPPSVQIAWQGSLQAFTSSMSNSGWLLLAAIFTVYIVLGVLYESYIHPVTILSTLPSAGVGALLALLLYNLSLDIVAIIGLILLIGIVKKNAIMMIDFALEAERNEHLSPQDAIHQACLLRFRPIIMTTLAALFGALPLMLGTGMGSELRNPLGITMVGGLLLSQVLTLFTTPVVYLYFDRMRLALVRRFGENRETA